MNRRPGLRVDVGSIRGGLQLSRNLARPRISPGHRPRQPLMILIQQDHALVGIGKRDCQYLPT